MFCHFPSPSSSSSSIFSSATSTLTSFLYYSFLVTYHLCISYIWCFSSLFLGFFFALPTPSLCLFSRPFFLFCKLSFLLFSLHVLIPAIPTASTSSSLSLAPLREGQRGRGSSVGNTSNRRTCSNCPKRRCRELKGETICSAMQQQPQQQQQPPPQLQQQGGSQFGADMAPFAPSGASPPAHVLQIPGAGPLHPPPQPSSQLVETAPALVNRRPPAPTDAANFDELAPAVAGGFHDDEAITVGYEAERGGTPGSRWPRQETLALLKIRSEMDAAFRDATFKGPLWEEVSRKLAELGYKRSAKKCKEKFENVHKYYKRTKDGRAGRQDGKTYRFFNQLEALHSSGGGGATTPTVTPAMLLTTTSPAQISFTTAPAGPPATRVQASSVSAAAPPPVATPSWVVPDLGPQANSSLAAAGISFSSDSTSSSSSESDDEETEDAGESREGRKRKRSGGSRARQQMMTFFQGLMRQVMERQEAMQQRFLEAIEKREQDRLIREDAWRLQEMARLSREQELLSQERAMAASRDTAVISYLQKISGQPVTSSSAVPASAAAISLTPLPLPPSHAPPPPQPPPQQQQEHQQKQGDRHHTPKTDVTATQRVTVSSEPEEGHCFEPVSSSRWPKEEVHALIKLRSGLGSRYQEAGPKGPLWEDISAGMHRLGYNRSAKRCKEKWENINKYFKKVKDSNKKRPEDSKSCPYFHELEALYRKKTLGSDIAAGDPGGGSSAVGQQKQEQDTNPSPLGQQQQRHPAVAEGQNGDNNKNNISGGNPEAGGGSTVVQVQTRNGQQPPSFPDQEGTMKPEDVVKVPTEQRHPPAVMDEHYKMDKPSSDNLDQDDDYEDEDDEDEVQYKLQFQRQIPSGDTAIATTAAATATASGTFLAMVQ
ncbi:trihelix transcription factor GTL1-like isoform X1 [Musa acuminata AAA Group]|uniref:trihelix transcription factor GTL1-like isoform X1 n=1 Tax=Musa acuminata AAA Group TaxID=214697 RepID=UPI0031DECC12